MEYEFVEDDFSTVSEACPNCKGWICFLPTIKSLVKEDHKKIMALGLELNEVEKISVKEWECHNCKTTFINIKE